MGRRILAQAGAISAVATQIMRGDLSQRLPVRDADDEINTLAREINSMLDKIEQLTLGMRTVLDSAAHDLRTPLNRLQATAEGAMSQLAPGSAERRVLERVTTEVDHMRSTLGCAAAHRARRDRHRGARTGGLVGTGREHGGAVCAGERGARHPARERRRRRARRCRAAASCWRRRWRTCSTMPSNSRPTAAASACCCKRTFGRDRRSSSRTTVREYRPTSARSCSGRRVRLDEARKFPGSGLGLSLVAAVTKLHGARLVLDDAAPGLRVSLKF